jgi:hypothetical protein
MQTLSTPPVRNEPNPLTQFDIGFLQENQYRQDRHLLLIEAFLVVIRSHPKAEKKHFASAFYSAANYAFPTPREEA